MAKKYRAEHITIFAVYKKFAFPFSGHVGRYFQIAYPKREQAEDWVKCELDKGINDESDFMIEEMPAIMKAWQP